MTFPNRNTVFRVAAVLLFALSVRAEKNPDVLLHYSNCKPSADFTVVQTDRLPQAMERTIATKDGEKTVTMLDGYRVLVAYKQEEPFVNLKVELFDGKNYAAEKQTIIQGLEFAASKTS